MVVCEARCRDWEGEERGDVDWPARWNRNLTLLVVAHADR